MHRSYALSLGSVAMAMVAVRGAMRHELASEVAVEAIIARGAFAVLGGIAGAVADYLVRNELEAQYRRRVAWYCEQQERREAIKKSSHNG